MLGHGYRIQTYSINPGRLGRRVKLVTLIRHGSGMFQPFSTLPGSAIVPVYKDAQDQLNGDRFCRECYQ